MDEQSNNDNIKDFLKGYAELLREGVDLADFKSGVFPLRMKYVMAGGYIEITTDSGDFIATVSVDEGGGPSMPIGPVASTFANLFVNLANAYYEYKTQNIGD